MENLRQSFLHARDYSFSPFLKVDKKNSGSNNSPKLPSWLDAGSENNHILAPTTINKIRQKSYFKKLVNKQKKSYCDNPLKSNVKVPLYLTTLLNHEIQQYK